MVKIVDWSELKLMSNVQPLFQPLSFDFPIPTLNLTCRSRLKVNHILLTTATGVKYELEAASAEDRDSWVSEIKIASKLITHS